MLLGDIDSWNVGALQSIAFEPGDRLKTIGGVAAQAQRLRADLADELRAAADVHDKQEEDGGEALDLSACYR